MEVAPAVRSLSERERRRVWFSPGVGMTGEAQGSGLARDLSLRAGMCGGESWTLGARRPEARSLLVCVSFGHRRKGDPPGRGHSRQAGHRQPFPGWTAHSPW